LKAVTVEGFVVLDLAKCLSRRLAIFSTWYVEPKSENEWPRLVSMLAAAGLIASSP
jgi:hypothetical protein